MMNSTRRRGLALFAAAFVQSALAATPDGAGRAATETRAIGSFEGISLKGGIDLIVRQASRESVQVRADAHVLPLVQAFVEGSGDSRTLHIRFKPGASLPARTEVVVSVEVVKLGALASAGSGDILVEALKTPALALSLSGASDAQLRRLDTEQLSVSIVGSGDVQARGRAGRLDISIAGSGDVQTHDLAADEVSIAIAGSGDASVTAHKTLSVTIAGSGDVEYRGDAVLARRSIVGSGTLRRRPH